MDNKIKYDARTYDDYRKELLSITQNYYPDVFGRLDDASIGEWIIEILSDIGDNLNFHIDRVYQETDLQSASQLTSLQNIARTNGLRIGGKKAALCEIEFSCNVPLQDTTNRDGNMAIFDSDYCPVIKRGTLFSNGAVTFELMEDIDFSEQFDENGYSNRTILPVRDSNGLITEYKLTKIAVVQAGQSKIYKKVITSEDIKPFMEILIQDNNILGVEGIVVKKGTNFTTDPVITEFYSDSETYKDKLGNTCDKYFEVENLIDQYRFGEDETVKDSYENGKLEEIEENVYDSDGNLVGSVVTERCVKGKWKRLKNKFVTEYDDNWFLKIIFGAGLKNAYGNIPTNAKDFTQYMMSRMQANDYMGVLPEVGSTLYVLYRVGGGEMSNIAAGTLNSIIFNNFEIKGNCDDAQNNEKKNRVRGSFKVTNTVPSYGGKDEPTEEEIKYLIKYNNGSQNRCVTLHDYKVRLNQLPAKFGCPFRLSVTEENNKVIVYALGLNSEGKLSSPLSETVANNMIDYLSHYKMLNDFIEFRSGKIINIKFMLTVYVDKAYDKSEVAKRIIDTVYDYMDIKKHEMGDDIFLGDMTKQISQLDGVIQLSDIRAYNMIGNGYSNDIITQDLVENGTCSCDYENIDSDGSEDPNVKEINLNSSDMMLFSDCNAMYEILNKNSDIVVRVKTR